jgi:excinuclease ABC subunit C
MNRSARHAVLIDKVRRQSPEGPGVYLFRGDRDEILYVGKAVNLQRRMLSHLRVDPLADASRHSRMVFEVRDFEFQTTASELLALLREDELIKFHRPRFNIRQNEFLEYRYLELTAEEYPRLRLLDHEDVIENRRVFGPYPDRYFIDNVLGLIRDHLGLRSCGASVPLDRCLEFDLGHCTGPCRNVISPGRYEQVVVRTVAFLDGDVSDVGARLARAMESASERLDYEKAQELKERLGFCNRLGERQRFFAAFRDRILIVVEEAADHLPCTYVFQRGRLTIGGTAAEPASHAEGQSISAGDPTTVGEDPRFLLDRAAIVHRWVRRNSERCRFHFADLTDPA